MKYEEYRNRKSRAWLHIFGGILVMFSSFIFAGMNLTILFEFVFVVGIGLILIGVNRHSKTEYEKTHYTKQVKE